MRLREYRYIGPADLASTASAPIERFRPKSRIEIQQWLWARGLCLTTVTFVVDRNGHLWISERGTEHVACARGEPVLAAGELTLEMHGARLEVTSITNQSTGYCPETSCWSAVQTALERAGLPAPPGFTHAFEFRRCPGCATINILKDEVPECPVCGDELPGKWNLG